jgi:hypothetical protein
VAWLVLAGWDAQLVLLVWVSCGAGSIGPLIISLTGEGVEEYLSRTGEVGADWEWYLVVQKLVRSDTLRRLPDLF